MKRDKPIDVTMKLTAAEAVMLLHVCNCAIRSSLEDYLKDRIGRESFPYIADRQVAEQTKQMVSDFSLLNETHTTLYERVYAALTQRGIGYDTTLEEPPPPIIVGEYAVEFESDCLRVGCTTVTYDLMNQIIERMETAKAKAKDEDQ